MIGLLLVLNLYTMKIEFFFGSISKYIFFVVRDAQIAPAIFTATAPRQFWGCPRRNAFPL
jgi:hypothetical protein